MALRQQSSPIEFKGGKQDEICKSGNMFPGYLGDFKFVPRADIYLGGYSLWGDSRCPGVCRDVQN